MHKERAFRPPSNFDLPSASDVWGNITAGANNLKLALSGHPVDAITQSAIQTATQQAQTAGKTVSPTAAKTISSTATVSKVQTAAATDVSNAVGSIFSGFKWLVVAIIVILALVLFIKK